MSYTVLNYTTDFATLFFQRVRVRVQVQYYQLAIYVPAPPLRLTRHESLRFHLPMLTHLMMAS